MQRRTVLATVSAVVVGGTGCLGRSSTNGPNDSPNGSTPGRRIEDEPCPSFDDHTDRTICYHTRDREEAPVYVEPSNTVGTVESFGFTLHNQAEQPFGLNPYAWAIYRQDDGDWKHVAPDAVPEPYTRLPPGDTIRWSLEPNSSSTPGKTNSDGDTDDSVQHTPAQSGQPKTDRETQPRVITVALKTGTCAFEISGTLRRDIESTRIECIALFRVET